MVFVGYTHKTFTKACEQNMICGHFVGIAHKKYACRFIYIFWWAPAKHMAWIVNSGGRLNGWI